MAGIDSSKGVSTVGYELTDVWTDGTVLLFTNLLLWLVSIPLGKTWPVDLIWSNFPIYQCIAIYVRDRDKERGNRDRQLMVFCLVCVWGFRLTHNFVARGGIGHEDWRYADMRTMIGKYFWIVSLFSVFFAQSVFLWGGSLSLHGALTEPTPINYQDWIAFGVTLCSILLEAISDIQMNDFIAARKEKKTDKVVIDTGVWKWSRHPNYLGEILFWWGLYLFTMSGVGGNDGRNDWWVVLGPVAMTFLIGIISVKLMEDRQLARKGKAFVRYRREVGSPLLLLPPVLNSPLGRCLYGSDDDDGSSNNKGDDEEEEEEEPEDGIVENQEITTTDEC